VLPLLNGLDHIAILRRRFRADSVLAGTIRVEADRPEPGVVVHTSPFLLVEMASEAPSARAGMEALGKNAVRRGSAGSRARFRGAGDVVKARAAERAGMHHERVRRAARDDPLDARDARLPGRGDRGGLRGWRAEGAKDVDPATAIAELEMAHAHAGQLDAAGYRRGSPAGGWTRFRARCCAPPRRHQISCPTIERLVEMITSRIAATAC